MVQINTIQPPTPLIFVEEKYFLSQYSPQKEQCSYLFYCWTDSFMFLDSIQNLYRQTQDP